MFEIIQAMLAPLKYYDLWRISRTVLVGIIVLLSLVAIACVIMQNGNSNGIDAISGSSETFYSKNKGRSKESVLKIITVVCLIGIGVCCIGFYLLELLA
ncbi:MAG: preprotein translocase subunit SecG [Clostridia bacterium]|nr:preprotein translocase subunit SecG [Clostridia bacterium]